MPIRRARRRTAASAQLLLHALDGQPIERGPARAMAALCYRPGEELTALYGAELADWANGVGARHGYSVELLGIGTDGPELGAPTQMAVFHR